MSGVAGPASELEEALIASWISIQSYDCDATWRSGHGSQRDWEMWRAQSHQHHLGITGEASSVQVMLEIKGDGSLKMPQLLEVPPGEMASQFCSLQPQCWQHGEAPLLYKRKGKVREAQRRWYHHNKGGLIYGKQWELCSLAQGLDRKVITNITAWTDREIKIFCSRV